MAPVKCFKCGSVNSSDNTTCENCGEKLLKGQEYEERFQELKDYEDFRKRYSFFSIVLAILVLLLLWPAVKWFIRLIFSMPGTVPLPPVISEYAVPAIILLVFLLAILPMILGRCRIRRKYHWSREWMQRLDLEIKSLPPDFFVTSSETPIKKIQGPPTILLAIIFALLVLVYLDKYTEYKPLNSITSLSGTGSGTGNTPIAEREESTYVAPNAGQPDLPGQAIVAGKYDCYVAAKDLGGGVMRSEQTWSYVFHSDGTYTSYLEGSQQFSGTWSQSGNILTINVPAIANLSAAYSFQATVSRDGNSFTSGERTFIKVN